MESERAERETVDNVILHLHKYVVLDTLKTHLKTILTVGKVQKETRLKGAWELYDVLEDEDKSKFVAGFVSIAEIAVQLVLDFIEKYTWFESADNDDEFPRLSLMYNSRSPDGVKTVELSQFCPVTELKPQLRECFKTLAKSNQVRDQVESAIKATAERLARPKGV